MKFFIITVIITTYLGISKSEDRFDVTKFGADTKGVNTSSDAITKAIDEAVKTGGGTILFPKGTYLTSGPIHLKSNITLSLESGSIIKFSDNFDDYLPMVPMRWEGLEVINYSPLLYAYKQENITIKGQGTLDGQGQKWWTEWIKLSTEYETTGKRSTKYQEDFIKANNLTEIKTQIDDTSRIEIGFLRPSFIQPFESNNILIEDVTIENSPFWNINPAFCNNVTIKGVKIRAPDFSNNTDGIDPDSCVGVLITNVDIDVGDDCVAINSGRDLQGRKRGRPTENVLITNSVMHRGHSGVTIGSAMSGGVRNVTVRDCIFNGTDAGFKLKSTRGRGGVIEDIHYMNITMHNIKLDAILLTMHYSPSAKLPPTKPEPFSERTPIFRNVKIHNFTVDSVQNAITLIGLEESFIHNMTIKEFDITAKNGVELNFTDTTQIDGMINTRKITINEEKSTIKIQV